MLNAMTIRELYLKYVSQYYNFQGDLKCCKVFFGKEASEYFRKQLQTLFRKNVFVELETAMIVSSQTIA